jgi:protein SCO1/2
MILWGLVIAAAVVATVLFVFRPFAQGGLGSRMSLNPVGSFSLASTKGGRFTEADLKGTPTLLFFGFTYCPNVCPTTLSETVAWKQKLGLTSDQLRTVFVTIDPERDTLDMMASYTKPVDPSIIGLVGTPAETANIAMQYRVTAEKADDGNGSYTMLHTATVFLIDANGAYQGSIDWEENEASALAKIKRLVGG